MNDEELQRLIAEERQRIARDLHDLVLQRLFATGIMLEGALRKAIVEDVQLALKQALVDLDETVGQIRSTVHSLNSNQDSVRQKILHEIEVARTHWGYVIDFNLKGPIDTVMSPNLSEDVVAVTAELLNNAGRHANANADDPTFADGCIKNAGFTVLFLKPRSRAEYAAEIANVFPHDDNFGVFRQHHVQGAIDRLNHVHGFGRGFRHQRASHSGPNLSRCSSNICSHCSFKCHGISSNTSSNMLSIG